MATIPLILSCLLAQHVARVTPDFDLALEASDLVVVGRIRDARTIEVREILHGVRPAGTLRLADTSRLGLHYHAPAGGAQHLLFLHRALSGWIVTQSPGLTPAWTPSNAVALRRLIGLLRALQGRRAEALQAVPGHVAFAASQSASHPELAAAALRAVARRPDLASGLERGSRALLNSLLADTRTAVAVRDHAARCLAGAGDSKLPMQLVGLLTAGKAAELGPVFGRLLHQQLGERCLPLLRGALLRSAGGAHAEILQAAWETRQLPAQQWVLGLAQLPTLAPLVRRITHGAARPR